MSPAAFCYRSAVAAHMTLFALLMGWIIVLAPPPEGLIAPVLIVVVAPLLTPLRGLLARRRYTMAWSTLLIPAYLVHGIYFAAGPGMAGWLGVAEAALVVLYFSAVTAYLRLTRPAAARPG